MSVSVGCTSTAWKSTVEHFYPVEKKLFIIMPEYRVVRTAIDKTNTNNLDKSAIFRPRRRSSERNKQGVTLVTAYGYNFCRALHLPKIEKQTQIYYQSDYKMDAIFNPPRKN